MPDVIVRNNLNPNKAVKFNVNIKQLNSKFTEGEEKYYIEVGTTHSGIYKDKYTTISGVDSVSIRPLYIDATGGKDLDTLMSEVLGTLSSYIDWGPLVSDITAPHISNIEPVGSDVSIYANIKFIIEDFIPTTGIDLSEVSIFLNNGTTTFDITNEFNIEGTPFKYTFFWEPKIRAIEGVNNV
jgi:hypothetical protein